MSWYLCSVYNMEINNLIITFEQKLKLQKYSTNSIKNYCSAVKCFLHVVEKKFDHPNQLTENNIEKYVLWKIEPLLA